MDSPANNDMRITEEAADWLVELKASGAACHAEFFEWVRRSPEHVREFLAVTGLARKLQGADPRREIDIRALLDDVRAEIVPLGAATTLGAHRQTYAHGHSLGHLPPGTQPPARVALRSRRRYWSTAAALAAVAVAAGAWFALAPETYATRIGEQRSFALGDGSLIYLNTDSRARVHFTAQAREVELLSGEALFTVERDATRPFRVKAGSATVQVVGTQFNVYRHANAETTVSVIEGAVLAGATRLGAGEQANIHRDGEVAKVPVADLGNVIAWRQRQLVFRKTPLTEVAAEFNRYNPRHIRVDEQLVRERQITGVFAADRPESFVSFLKKDPQISVRQDADGWAVEGTP